jgi:actin-like ATPase involved in cell morphogenesis
LKYGLGVDLGTSFTRAAISRGGQSRMISLTEQSFLMPAVVQVRPDGSLIAGEAATRDEDPTAISRDFKRRLGDPTPLMIGGQLHSAVSLLAATLSSVIDTLTEAEGEAPDRLVLTCPAVWGPYRQEHFQEVPRQAGLSDVTVVTEPVAAATHYAARQKLAEGDVVAIYDLGGGTFDTTVAARTRTGIDIMGVPEGVEWVGGIDFDEAVFNHVDLETGGAFSALDPEDKAGAIALDRIRAECIRAKERLSRDEAVNIPVLLPNRHTQVRLTRAQFEDMIRPAIESTVAALRRTLESATVAPKDLASVLLVGGSSRIPLVSRMLSQDLGRPVLVDPYPQHCVALGAAAIAGRGLAVTANRSTLRSGGRRRRRLVAVTATTALLVGAGLYTALDSRTQENTGNRAPAGVVPDQTVSASPTATPSRTAKPSAKPTSKPPTPSKPFASIQAGTSRATTASASSSQVTAAAVRAPDSPKLPVTDTTVHSLGLCLDVANAQAKDGAEIHLADCNGSAAQIWTLGTDNTFRALGRCMDVSADPTVSAPVETETCDDLAAQRWTMTDSTIVNQKSGLCLTVNGDPSLNRGGLIMDSCHGGDSQTWTLP